MLCAKERPKSYSSVLNTSWFSKQFMLFQEQQLTMNGQEMLWLDNLQYFRLEKAICNFIKYDEHQIGIWQKTGNEFVTSKLFNSKITIWIAVISFTIWQTK